jgi:hypothetical protein
MQRVFTAVGAVFFSSSHNTIFVITHSTRPRGWLRATGGRTIHECGRHSRQPPLSTMHYDVASE